jgi:hypothetical protein
MRSKMTSMNVLLSILMVLIIVASVVFAQMPAKPEVVFYNTGSEYDPSILALGVQASKFGGMPVYLDSPAVLLGKADTLQLTAEQQVGLQGIIDKARQDAAVWLTEEQFASISPIRAEPVVLKRVSSVIPSCSTGSCGPVCPE